MANYCIAKVSSLSFCDYNVSSVSYKIPNSICWFTDNQNNVTQTYSWRARLESLDATKEKSVQIKRFIIKKKKISCRPYRDWRTGLASRSSVDEDGAASGVPADADSSRPRYRAWASLFFFLRMRLSRSDNDVIGCHFLTATFLDHAARSFSRYCIRRSGSLSRRALYSRCFWAAVFFTLAITWELKHKQNTVLKAGTCIAMSQTSLQRNIC